MYRLFEEWSDEIRTYCNEHSLNFEKLKALSQCWGKDFIAFQYYDPESEAVKNGLGLLDETPMPLVLLIRKDSDGNLIFEHTEYTKQYLT